MYSQLEVFSWLSNECAKPISAIFGNSTRFLSRVLCAALIGWMGIWKATSGEAPCGIIPGIGSPFHYGLHRVAVSQSFSDTASPADAVWLQDGRLAVSYTGFSAAAPKRAIIRITSPVSKQLRYDQPLIQPPASASSFSFFGGTLATSGNFLAATFKMTNDTWAVSIHEATNASSWVLRTILQPDVPSSETFGSDMAMSGRWIALVHSGPNGGIYMFRRDDSGEWQRKALLKIPGFPSDLTLSPASLVLRLREDLLALGQLSDGFSNNGFTGRVHLWRLQPNDSWALETSLSVAGARAQDRLGAGLALAKDFIFAGASGRDEGATNAGVVYIFHRQNGVWKNETKLLCPKPIEDGGFGFMIDHSDIGPHLSVGNARGFFQFIQEEGNWVYKGRNGGGNVFYNWPIAANTYKTFQYGSTNSRPNNLIQRGHQVIGMFPSAQLFELGHHLIITRPITNDGPYHCYSTPLNYEAIGADSSVPTDGDNDRISDLEEGYFGTLGDISNSLDGKLHATRGPNGELVVQWPRAIWPDFPIQVLPQWSQDLSQWTSEGVSITKVGTEPGGEREILQATLPAPLPEVTFFRLLFSLPSGPPSESWP